MRKNKREAARILAKIIDDRTTEVRDALFDSGVRISPNATPEEIVDTVIPNLGFNKRLQNKLGRLAVEVSPSTFAEAMPKPSRRERLSTGFYNQGGDVKWFETQAGQQGIDVAGQVAGVWLAGLLAQKQAEKQAQLQGELLEKQAQADIANAELVKSQLTLKSLENQSKAQLGPSGKLAVGTLIVVALLGAFYFYNKSQPS